jgi:hypothetical protein
VLLKEVDAKILNKNSVKKTHLKIKMMYLDWLDLKFNQVFLREESWEIIN